jgi:hypothetical protein
MSSQISTISNQIQALYAQQKAIAALRQKGIILLAVDALRTIILLIITFLPAPFYTFLHLDPGVFQLCYLILLFVEASCIFTRKPKRSQKLTISLALWILFSLYYFFIGRPNLLHKPDFFYLCGFFQLYPLFMGILSLKEALKASKSNAKAIQDREAERHNLQQKLHAKKNEYQKGLHRKREHLHNLKGKKVQQIAAPTDQEFDAWLEERVKEGLTGTLRKLGLEEEIANPRKLLRVRGYVLQGMKDAHYYNAQDLHYKLGADQKRRYSVNLYTYFYPADDRIMVFTYHINAMNWNDYRETTREYFYQDVIGATTEDDRDMLHIDGKKQLYRTQRFSLRICDGTAISATVRSRPLDDMTNLPVFDDIPQSDIENTIAQIRKWLRDKKA